ncbi:protein transport protein Sec61 subunit gamma [Drosophila persimilis]|uniref:protein transport protein Sec61 subunit gamma n=1 Tax=Drosophila persimilis TaxID=7234 RepID=UPI000F0955CB|nr:protein transport protein Sec61 subunit gamma [Drosophila persimilis]
MYRLPHHRRQRQKPNNGFLGKMCKDFQRMSWGPNGRPMFDFMVLSTVPFITDGLRFFKRCHKPDRREFKRTAVAVGVGILLMGLVGYIVKLLQIPLILSSYQNEK